MVWRGKNKKIERPKSVLGNALFAFDTIYDLRLKNIIESIIAEKRLNSKKMDKVIKIAFSGLDKILDDISKDHFKTDYRSDKIRENLISIIDILRQSFLSMKSYHYEFEKIKETGILKEMEKISMIRNQIKQKMKDIEGDYL